MFFFAQQCLLKIQIFHYLVTIDLLFLFALTDIAYIEFALIIEFKEPTATDEYFCILLLHPSIFTKKDTVREPRR